MEKKTYNHKLLEPRWQKHWEENKVFKCEPDDKKPKYYVLDMFPYPSGAGLHVGHPVGYTATDIMARYKRQKGFNVLHPMGWDSFGLPAEQYAVRTGTHPATTTKKNINNIRKQLKQLGFSYDWDREIATSDPDYYKWTQWIFTKLYEKELAYEAMVHVNFCPQLGTVLSNEEVEGGLSKLGGYPVERRPLRQWVLKITAYAERLLDDLEDLDWPEGLKKLQHNWIGRSEGAQLYFKEEKTQEVISVFTTCPDTLFGATFLVLAPEHPLVKQIMTQEQQVAVTDYIKKATTKSDLERTGLSKKKTGVWTGSYAINPVNNKKVPIWISDYVLVSYGTGAIMAVPAHDERDFEFACTFKIPIIAVIDPGVQKQEELLGDDEDWIKLRVEVLNGKRCWPNDGILINSSHEDVSIDGMNVSKAKKYMTNWVETKGFGIKKINYKIRDWLFSRQRYWGEPFPVLHLEDGTIRTLDIDELPLISPEVANFKPSPTGESPLATAQDWVEIIDSKTGKKAYRETNTMPQWAGSCWYYLRFCDPKNTQEAWDKNKENYWMPVDLYIGGAEHAVLHLLYARFWHKVLYDCGLVTTKEPFQKLCNQGLVTATSYRTANNVYVSLDEVLKKEGEFYHAKTNEKLFDQVDKMSKSKLNGISPDEIIEEYGADALRLYEMFMGPIDKEKIWKTEGVGGCKRFLNRFFELCVSDKVTDKSIEQALKLGHRLVHGVTQDIEELQFNTAIAKMMTFVNDFTKLSTYPKDVLKMTIQCLSSFAPHISQELWEHLGFTEELSFCPFIEVNPSYLQDDTVTYIVQVNGKLRGRFDLPRDLTQETIIKLAEENPNIKKYLTGDIIKLVFVPNKLINFVMKK